MSKVYVVSYSNEFLEEVSIKGVFSSPKLAREFRTKELELAKYIRGEEYLYEIEEHELDEGILEPRGDHEWTNHFGYNTGERFDYKVEEGRRNQILYDGDES